MSCPQNKRLRIPQSRVTRLFRHIADTAQGDDSLRAVKNWHTGKPEEADLVGTPGPDECPFVRLFIAGVGGSGSDTNISQGGRLQIGVEVYTQGMAFDDMVDLFMLLVGVVSPPETGASNAYRQELRALGAIGAPVEIVKFPVPGPVRDKDGNFLNMLAGEGQIALKFRIQN